MKQINPGLYKRLFTQAVIVYPQASSDSLGDYIESSPVTYKGYVHMKMEKVITTTGEEVISGTQIYMQGSDIESIDVHSKVTCAWAIKQPILCRELWYGDENSEVIGILYLP